MMYQELEKQVPALCACSKLVISIKMRQASGFKPSFGNILCVASTLLQVEAAA
jgi:hypothetical protein